MDEFLSQLLQAVEPLAILIITALLTWVLLLLKNKIKNAEVKNALEVLANTTNSVVNGLNMTDVANMKTESGTNSLSAIQTVTVKQKAKDRIVAEMPDAVYTTLEKANVDMDSRLNSEIENQVGSAKQVCTKAGEV